LKLWYLGRSPNKFYQYFIGKAMKHLGYIIACFIILLNVHLVEAQGDVKIGTQIWTSKNLDVSTFRNGDAIPEAINEEEWEKARENKTAAFCYKDFDKQNGQTSEKLYNWYAVNDPRGLAPIGYHIPSDKEWSTLIQFLGGDEKAGFKMKSKSGWAMNRKKKSGNGNNSSGFNALPNGNWFSFGGFVNYSYATLWWSSITIDNEENTESVWCFRIENEDAKVVRTECDKFSGLSVRCLKD
jgi:uncharacterized protein (TIGR02145 family)